MIEYKNLTLVGIGIKVDGYESMQNFFSNVTLNDNITYIIVQDLDSSFSSEVGEILGKYTHLVVKKITNNLKIKSNIIYYCPSNKALLIKNDKFFLIKPTLSSSPSIDCFLTSLAKEKKEKAIGIVLSGSGDDGVNGVKEIVKNGGIALCEDKNIKHYYVSKSIFDTNEINVSLSTETLAEIIPNIIEDKDYFIKYSDVKTHLKEIFHILSKEVNIDFSNYKEGTIIRRIEKRMKAIKLNDINNYIKLLEKDKNEIERLKNDFLIIVTSFFRDKDAFSFLKDKLKRVVVKSTDSLRVWVPACATSQEVYSISILLFEIFEEFNISKNLTIFATDISDKIIKEARKKTFTIEDMREVDKIYKDKYFDKVDNNYKPKKVLRDVIVFSQHNLIKDPPFLNIDFISCRNLLIYFNAELQKQIFGTFYYSLKVDGLLFLGKSETIGNLNFLFSPLSTKYKIYKKSSDLKKMDIDSLVQRANLIPNTNKIIKKTNMMDIDYFINKAVTDIKIISGVVVDKNNNILFYKGDCSQYLAHPQGLSSNNLLTIIKDYLKLDLRIIINQVKNDIKYIKSKKIPIFNKDYKKEYVVIEVFSLEKNKLGEKTYFISFNTKIINNTYNSLSTSEEEIVRLKNKLQKTLESLEISNQELRVANEELQSTNEELQSTNEEIETSNEELQSTNEELQTVNIEMMSVNADIKFTNEIFNRALTILNASLLVLDINMDVIKYTDGIKNFFDLENMEHKNLKTMLVHSTIYLPSLIDDIEQCLLNNKNTIYNIEYKSRSYSILIHKITTPVFYNNNKKIQEGVMLKFLDKTDIVKKDQLLFQQSKMASMGEMIANIAHQWRQPLNALSISNSHLVKKYRDNNLNDEFMENFNTKSKTLIQKMSSTIDDFRNFFNPEKNIEEFTLNQVILDTVKFMDDSFKSRNIKLNILSYDKELILNGYKNELTQVLIIILNNAKDAIEAINQNSAEIVINTKRIHSDIVITISDNGGGIDDKNLYKVFEPYFTTKFKSDGTGVGLYIAKMIIEESMNGSLKMENFKEGVLVTIKIPKDIK